MKYRIYNNYQLNVLLISKLNLVLVQLKGLGYLAITAYGATATD